MKVPDPPGASPASRPLLLDLSPRSALEGALLPADDLSDPVDRMLVAAARIEDATLVTADQRILEYGRAGGVRTFPAG